MTNREHAGRYIGAYYWHVAYPNFDMPGSSLTQSKTTGVSIAHHELGDARLTTIRRPNGRDARYIRFFNLAGAIPDEERSLLGFPTCINGRDDLVVACPDFQIVPSEVIHSAHERARLQDAMRSRLLPLPDNRWATVSDDKYLLGIYRRNEETPGLLDMSNQLPATVDACLSVAHLLVMRNVAMFLGSEGSASL